MRHQILHEKIDRLPEHVTAQVADYLDFLIERHAPKEEESLTAEQKQYLDEAEQEYLDDPSTAISWEDAKKQLFAKYGR